MGIVLGLVACGQPSPAEVRVLPVRSDATIHRLEECDAFLVANPVAGDLAISQTGDRAEASLLTPDGRNLHITWPGGFSALANSGALLDDHGTVLYVVGDRVVLEQVLRSSHIGSASDPYVALGSFAGTCWGRST